MNKLHLDGWRDVTVVRENLGNAQCRQQSVAGSITQLPCLLESLRHAIKFMSPWITGSMDIISAFSQISIFTDSFASQLQVLGNQKGGNIGRSTKAGLFVQLQVYNRVIGSLNGHSYISIDCKKHTWWKILSAINMGSPERPETQNLPFWDKSVVATIGNRHQIHWKLEHIMLASCGAWCHQELSAGDRRKKRGGQGLNPGPQRKRECSRHREDTSRQQGHDKPDVWDKHMGAHPLNLFTVPLFTGKEV
ncbi:hypothetical protein FB45DRAFT_871165 [Roridomyces roridus]|uniref:Uncharacterized protein n=1 Tax=Roridomyces roridus TaxID=1738132 RepID=A0AAD7FI42_9AGAR|nr:hypothetical protein FB45DRAFT_871165 [Roridomyces roridus]